MSNTSSSYLLGSNANTNDNINNNYESLTNNGTSNNDNNKNKNDNNQRLLSKLEITALCATWFALGVWIYIFIV